MSHFVLAHGFTQTARSWSTIEQLVRSQLPDARTMAIDLPGHGDTEPPADDDLWASARRLVDRGGVGTYVGYSMGGRVALHAALLGSNAVQCLVLIGATAGIDDPAERETRRIADDALATRIESIGVPAFLDEWLRNPLFAGLTEAAARRSDRLRNTAAGLAASLRATGTGMQEPLWDRLGEITVPVLVLVGERDDKFAAIGRRLVDAIGDATFTSIPDAGHSVHLEQPEATVDAIIAWLSNSQR